MKRYFFRDLIYVLKSRYGIQNRKNKYSAKRRAVKIKYKAILILIIIAIVMKITISVFETKVKPIVDTMAKSRAKVIALSSISQGVREQVIEKIEYEDLITLEKDSLDRITALKSNIAKMNEMQALTLQVIQDRITNIDSSDLKIPLGNLFNSSILAGIGPKITIKIIPFGSVQGNFADEFISAGINQTKHKINLEFKATIIVIIPFSSIQTEVVDSIPIAETIIVGNVPETYLDNSDASPSESKRADGLIENFSTK